MSVNLKIKGGEDIPTIEVSLAEVKDGIIVQASDAAGITKNIVKISSAGLITVYSKPIKGSGY